MAAANQPSQKRPFGAEIENIGWVDQRGHEQHLRALTAIVAQHRALRLSDCRHRWQRLGTLRFLILTQAPQSPLEPFGISRSFAAQQCKE